MTTQEFSNEFDVLYNNIMSNQAPGLDEYEKSVFLTKAQNEILKNYFNPKGNKYQEGFDDNAKRQIDFSSLVCVAQPTALDDSNTYVKIDDRSKAYILPERILFIINEFVTLSPTNNLNQSRRLTIVPISFGEYSRLMSKPYKCPLKNQAWRLIQNNKQRIAEIIAVGGTLSNYVMRYVERPTPIILTNLDEQYSNVSIDGLTKVTECNLDEILHPEILQRAVELAKAAYVGDLNSTIELGKRSE